MDNSYAQENSAERQRLGALISRLSDGQLAQPMAAGWTVSAVLAHLAFWDLRAIVLLDKWQQQGIGPSPLDTDVVNEASRKLCLAISPRVAAQLAIDTATVLDQKIVQLDPAFIAGVERDGKTVRLNRGTHRHNHIAEIEGALEIS
jgi:hypothetical protein